MKKIKPQRGVTYECCKGFTDHMNVRVRRGTRYVFFNDNFRDYWFMFKASYKGFAAAVPKDKFESHFIPLNPLSSMN